MVILSFYSNNCPWYDDSIYKKSEELFQLYQLPLEYTGYITTRSTLTWSVITSEIPIYGSNRCLKIICIG